MVIISTSAVLASIQAVSPVSIAGGGAAREGGVGLCASALAANSSSGRQAAISRRYRPECRIRDVLGGRFGTLTSKVHARRERPAVARLPLAQAAAAARGVCNRLPARQIRGDPD